MLTRTLLPAAVGLVLTVVPASARPESGEATRLGEAMRDPAAQQTMAVTVRALSEALLSVRIAPLFKALEAVRGGQPAEVDPDLSLRDYAGPEAARMPEQVSRRVPAMMGAVGEMAGSFEAALPGLKAMADEMRERIDEAIDR